MDRNKVIESAVAVMRRRHYSPKTEKSYRRWIWRYGEFLKGADLGGIPREKKAEAFLNHLATNLSVSASTQNQAFSALLFLYECVLATPLRNVDALRAQKPVFERTSIPQEQLLPVLQSVKDTSGVPNRLICWLLYGCGLRLSEGLNVRLKDICLFRNRLTIQQAKGSKSRVLPLPRVLREALSRQIQFAELIWKQDSIDGIHVGALPFSLSRKYPNIGLKRSWAWLFPAPRRCEWRGRTVRYRVLEVSVQRALKKAVDGFDLDGLLTPHVLRHCFTSHFKGDIQVLSKLLGHAQIQTTMGYRHPECDSAVSPLDEALPANVIPFAVEAA